MAELILEPHAVSQHWDIPPGHAEQTLTLNVSVYGLAYEQLARITDEAAIQIAKKYGEEVQNQKIRPRPVSGQHNHNHPLIKESKHE